MEFKAESFFNPHLGLGVSRLDAVLTVTAKAGEGQSARRQGSTLVIFVADVSGSMNDDGKLDQMKHAVRVGIDSLDEGVMFAVIAFNGSANVIVPPTQATAGSRAAAHQAVQKLRADGGTVMSNALTAARMLAQESGADIALVYFATDGENDKNDKRSLAVATEDCKGVLQANCWGIGTDWRKDDLTTISQALLGSADAAPNPAALQAKMRESLALGLSKSVSGVSLRLWMPRTVRTVTLKQMSPEIVDMQPLVRRVDDKTIEIPLGAWGAESRDYHLGFELPTQSEGEEMMVCRPKVVIAGNGVQGEEAFAGQNIVATWSSDDSLTTRINAQVAHYTGQEELATSIKEGLEAKARGDVDQATVLLGRAARIAIQTGNEEVTQRLRKVVDVIDANEGTVRLRAGASKGDDMELDLGGTRTVRRRPAAQAPNAGGN